MRVDLPSGGWAEIRQINEISERNRRPIAKELAQLSPEGLGSMEQLRPLLESGSATEFELEKLAKLDIRFSSADLDHFSKANDYCIVALAKEWSFGVPITMDSILDLSSPDYDTLRKVCAPASASLFVDFSMTKENVEDVVSPFGPSNGSSTSSSTKVAPSTNTSPSTNGEPTVS